MTKYASGKYALAICDRCGFRAAYNDLVTEAETGWRVHPACEDFPRPKPRATADAIALRHPRPDRYEDVDPPGSNDEI